MGKYQFTTDVTARFLPGEAGNYLIHLTRITIDQRASRFSQNWSRRLKLLIMWSVASILRSLNRITGCDVPTIVKVLREGNLFGKEMAKSILKYNRIIIDA